MINERIYKLTRPDTVEVVVPIAGTIRPERKNKSFGIFFVKYYLQFVLFRNDHLLQDHTFELVDSLNQ